MRSAGTKLSKEEYDNLKDYAESQGTSVSELLREFVQGLTEGKVEPRFRKDSSSGVRGNFPLCPRCGYLMFFDFRDNTLACIKCGHCFEVETPSWQEGESLKI